MSVHCRAVYKLASALLVLVAAGLVAVVVLASDGPRNRVPAEGEPFVLTYDPPKVRRRDDPGAGLAEIRIPFADSRAVGSPSDGRLVRGVQLPVSGPDHFSWDPARRRVPNRGWRRNGTFNTVTRTLSVLRGFASAHPGAARVGVGDLSRPEGGDFGRRFAGLGLGHASHQNGTDVDIYYPRRDRRETGAVHPRAIDRRLARDLVERFIAAGAIAIFVGPDTGLSGTGASPLANHNDHMHVRFPS